MIDDGAKPSPPQAILIHPGIVEEGGSDLLDAAPNHITTMPLDALDTESGQSINTYMDLMRRNQETPLLCLVLSSSSASLFSLSALKSSPTYFTI